MSMTASYLSEELRRRLGIRTAYLLQRNQITPSRLRTMTDQELLERRNLGKTTLAQIREHYPYSPELLLATVSDEDLDRLATALAHLLKNLLKEWYETLPRND